MLRNLLTENNNTQHNEDQLEKIYQTFKIIYKWLTEIDPSLRYNEKYIKNLDDEPKVADRLNSLAYPINFETRVALQLAYKFYNNCDIGNIELIKYFYFDHNYSIHINYDKINRIMTAMQGQMNTRKGIPDEIIINKYPEIVAHILFEAFQHLQKLSHIEFTYRNKVLNMFAQAEHNDELKKAFIRLDLLIGFLLKVYNDTGDDYYRFHKDNLLKVLLEPYLSFANNFTIVQIKKITDNLHEQCKLIAETVEKDNAARIYNKSELATKIREQLQNDIERNRPKKTINLKIKSNDNELITENNKLEQIMFACWKIFRAFACSSTKCCRSMSAEESKVMDNFYRVDIEKRLAIVQNTQNHYLKTAYSLARQHYSSCNSDNFELFSSIYFYLDSMDYSCDVKYEIIEQIAESLNDNLSLFSLNLANIKKLYIEIITEIEMRNLQTFKSIPDKTIFENRNNLISSLINKLLVGSNERKLFHEIDATICSLLKFYATYQPKNNLNRRKNKQELFYALQEVYKECLQVHEFTTENIEAIRQKLNSICLAIVDDVECNHKHYGEFSGLGTKSKFVQAIRSVIIPDYKDSSIDFSTTKNRLFSRKHDANQLPHYVSDDNITDVNRFNNLISHLQAAFSDYWCQELISLIKNMETMVEHNLATTLSEDNNMLPKKMTKAGAIRQLAHFIVEARHSLSSQQKHFLQVVEDLKIQIICVINSSKNLSLFKHSKTANHLKDFLTYHLNPLLTNSADTLTKTTLNFEKRYITNGDL